MPNISLKFKPTSDSNDDITITTELIDSVDSLCQMTSDASSIAYEGIANSGTINIIDKDDYIADLIEDEVIPVSNLPVELYVGDHLVQKHMTTDSSYDTYSKELTISLSNDIEKFNKLTYKGYDYPDESRNAYEMLYDVMSSYYGGTFPSNWSFDDMLSEEILYGIPTVVGSIADYLKAITIPYPYIESGQTYLSVINCFCTLAQLNFYINDDGNPVFSSARPLTPRTTNSQYYTIIPVNVLEDDFTRELFVKNKYDGVEVTEQSVTDETEYDEMVAELEISIPDLESLEIQEEIQSNANSDINIIGSDYYVATHIKETLYYYSGTSTIEIKQNQNLTKILKVVDSIKHGDSYIYNNTYNYTSGTATATGVFNTNSVTLENVSNISTNYSSETEAQSDQLLCNETYTFYINATGTGGPYVSVTSEISEDVNQSEITNIEYDEENNQITISYKILVGKEVIKLGGYFITSDKGVFRDSLSGYCYYYEPIPTTSSSSVITATISLYGNQRVISFSDSTNSTDDVESAVTVANITDGGTVLQTGTVYNETKVSDLIKQNILSDYSSGIKTANVTVSSVNYYDNFGNLVVDWSKGEILKTNTVLTVEKQNYKSGSPIFWKSTGRNFTWDGEPLTELELMEIYLYDTIIQYLYLEDLNGYQVYSVNGDISGSLIIPSTYNDGEHGKLNVVSIANSCFISLTYEINITNLSLPSTIIEIGSGAFLSQSLIEELTIPENVTSIGSEAFVMLSSLKTLNFNAKNCSDFSQASNVFTSCGKSIDPDSKELVISSEITVNFGQSVNKVPNYLFYSYDQYGSGWYEPANIISVLFSIPSDCLEIGNYAFYDLTSLKEISLPDSIEIIGEYAFSGCSSLTSLEIPNSVTSIGSIAFSRCSSLENIYYIGTLEDYLGITFGYNWCSSGYSLYIDEELITDIVIPDSVISIGNYVFQDCLSLTNLVIQDSVTEIGNYTFEGCTNLTTLTIGEGVNSISQYAFRNCTSLTEITIPDSVTTIGEYAFYGCTRVTTLTIGEGVNSISQCAFRNLTYLTTLNFNAKNCSHLTGGNRVFARSSYIRPGTTVTFGDSVEIIPSYLFDSSVAIITVIIGNSVYSIGSYAFSGCTSLTEVIIHSEYVYNHLTSTISCGYLGYYATTIKVLKTIVDNEDNSNTYLNDTSNFTVAESEDGIYYIYTKV